MNGTAGTATLGYGTPTTLALNHTANNAGSCATNGTRIPGQFSAAPAASKPSLGLWAHNANATFNWLMIVRSPSPRTKGRLNVVARCGLEPIAGLDRSAHNAHQVPELANFHATGRDLVARCRVHHMKTFLAATLFAVTTLALAAAASANCRIHNDTKWDFKIESGNTSNQSVGAHTSTTIASGKIKGVDEKAGKTISGSCKDGDQIEVIDDHGVPVINVK